MGAASNTMSTSLLNAFTGRYYFNNDQRMNFVAAENFDSDEEKRQMLELFHYIKDPKPRHDLPALKIMMLRSDSDSLFVHDTLYNIEISDHSDKLVMNCWTGDMQLTQKGQISHNQ